jgi:hypothetical protein
MEIVPGSESPIILQHFKTIRRFLACNKLCGAQFFWDPHRFVPLHLGKWKLLVDIGYQPFWLTWEYLFPCLLFWSLRWQFTICTELRLNATRTIFSHKKLIHKTDISMLIRRVDNLYLQVVSTFPDVVGQICGGPRKTEPRGACYSVFQIF